jgi:hypothetical protein
MLHDVLDRTPGHEMTERNVAQPRRNRRADVAQRARRDRASHIGLRLGLGALLGLGFGCANPASRPDGGTKDSGSSDATDAANGGCAVDCMAMGLACSLHRCTSTACQASESSGEGIAGCLFYTLQVDNVTADENATTSFLVANAGAAPANVTLEVAQPASGGTGWTELGELQVDVGASRRIPVVPVSASPMAALGVIPAPQVTAVGVTRKAALRIRSDQPVTVSEVESDNVDIPATSSGGTMLLPLQSLGEDHRVITYAQAPTNDVQMTAGSRGGSARVMVVGTQDGTTVRFTPVGPVTGDPSGDLPDIPAGGTHEVMLDDGDVFQIYSGAMGEDLTGARVFSTAPVAVFAGNISTTYGSNVTGINSADMAHEQMPPLSSWSKSYLAAAMTPQASIGCTSFFGMDGASIWRVLASHDGTLVKVAGPGIPLATYPLDTGAVQTLVELGSFTVTANYPILVTQGIDCEPSLSLAVAVGATTLLTSLPFAVPPSFDLLLEIVRPTGAEILLDGTAIRGAMFQAVGGTFELASIPLAPCIPTDGSGVCTHLLISSSKSGGFGMSLRGMDVGSSFAFTTPLVGCDPCLN